MSLIEQAAKRLEELQRSGAGLPTSPNGGTADGAPKREPIPTPEAIVRELDIQRGEAVSHPALRRNQPAAPAPKTSERTVVADSDRSNELIIDLDRLRELGFVTPDAPRSKVAHELRVLKRPILHNAQRRSESRVRDGNLVMVTSAVPGEGKTFTAVNLALSMAMELDNTVLLVDGDVAHPSLPDVLGLPTDSPGLLDLLVRDDLDFSDVVRSSNIKGLSILSAGLPNQRATELLASEKMVSLLRTLAAEFPDLITIFDSPPLLATTEARTIATHMGQIVMVVAADSTSKHAVSEALRTIEGCEVVLMMLNKATETNNSTYYGYYPGDASP